MLFMVRHKVDNSIVSDGSISNVDILRVKETHPWDIKDDMSLDEQALRSAFNPHRQAPDYQGLPMTPDLVRHLVTKYVEGLGEKGTPDEGLMGLVSNFLKPE